MTEEYMTWMFDYPDAYAIEEELHIIDDGMQDRAENMRRELYKYEMANE